MKRECYQIFVSYRRDGGEYTARILRDHLQERGYRVFFDLESLRSGNFNVKLYERIDECTDFLLILSPGALDRCVDDRDWVRREVEYALGKQKNVIPIMLRGFKFPEVLPQSMEELRYQNGIEASSQFFDAFLDRLCRRFIRSKPHGRRKQLIALLAGVCILAAGFGAARWLLSDRDVREVVYPSQETAAVAETVVQTTAATEQPEAGTDAETVPTAETQEQTLPAQTEAAAVPVLQAVEKSIPAPDMLEVQQMLESSRNLDSSSFLHLTRGGVANNYVQAHLEAARMMAAVGEDALTGAQDYLSGELNDWESLCLLLESCRGEIASADLDAKEYQISPIVYAEDAPIPNAFHEALVQYQNFSMNVIYTFAEGLKQGQTAQWEAYIRLAQGLSQEKLRQIAVYGTRCFQEFSWNEPATEFRFWAEYCRSTAETRAWSETSRQEVYAVLFQGDAMELKAAGQHLEIENIQTYEADGEDLLLLLDIIQLISEKRSDGMKYEYDNLVMKLLS